jgi:hypothetical protein
MFVDYKRDFIHFEDFIPGFTSWTTIPKDINIETGWLRHGAWLTEVERLALPYKFVMQEFNFKTPPTWVREPMIPWGKLTSWCPKLREVVIIMGGGKASTGKKKYVEDWVEISKLKLPAEPWCWRWGTPNFRDKKFKAYTMKRVQMVEVRFVKAK